MYPKRNYYLNDYFDLFNMPYNREKDYMKTDIYEKNNHYILEVDLPGIKKEHIKVNYENGYLTITATKNSLSSPPDKYIRRERLYGEIKRSFYIGIKKESDIKAIYKEGILNISFPKEDLPKNNNKNINIG
ncbi:MAG: Hsp20/alpha crystallin family protein [Bacilli bacterium]|nr:Hsp20/alpha crystallin family protein [Bacilli bacterium]